MWMFSVETVSSEGVKLLTLRATSPERVSELAIDVCKRRGYQGPSVLSAVRLYRVQS